MLNNEHKFSAFCVRPTAGLLFRNMQGQWLIKHNIPALYGIDTRMLTKHIRMTGTTIGCVNFGGKPSIFKNPNLENLVAQVTTKEVRLYGKGNSPKIIAFDCGMKHNIIRYFMCRKCELMVVPYDYDLAASAYPYDGIFVSNGPGDPTMASATIASIRWAITQKVRCCRPVLVKPTPTASFHLTEHSPHIWNLPRASNFGVGGWSQDVQDGFWQSRHEPAVHRHAHSPLLHHPTEPRVCREGQHPALGLETLVHERKRLQQRGHCAQIKAVFLGAVPSRSLRRCVVGQRAHLMHPLPCNAYECSFSTCMQAPWTRISYLTFF